MIDPAHQAAEARKIRYQAEFLDSFNGRRNDIHPDHEPWCTDNDGQPCARCAPLVERYDEIRASLPKLVVWVENVTETVLYRYWKLRLRFRRER